MVLESRDADLTGDLVVFGPRADSVPTDPGAPHPGPSGQIGTDVVHRR